MFKQQELKKVISKIKKNENLNSLVSNLVQTIKNNELEVFELEKVLIKDGSINVVLVFDFYSEDIAVKLMNKNDSITLEVCDLDTLNDFDKDLLETLEDFINLNKELSTEIEIEDTEDEVETYDVDFKIGDIITEAILNKDVSLKILTRDKTSHYTLIKNNEVIYSEETDKDEVPSLKLMINVNKYINRNDIIFDSFISSLFSISKRKLNQLLKIIKGE